MVAQIIYGVVLGIVQGITEFLPISSKGHLIIVQEPLERWLGLVTENPGPRRLEFDVVLHFGTLVALLIVYWRDLLRLHPRQWAGLVLGTIPIGVVGLLFHERAEEMFGAPVLAGIGLLVTATLLFIAQRFGRGTRTMEDMTPSRAFRIGCCQAAAIFPGVSRSGTTIVGGYLLGFQRNVAAKFSFLLAIPAISGACAVTAFKFLRHPEMSHGNSALSLVIGASVSLVVGLLSLGWLIRMISRGRLHWFGWYCLALGVFVICYF